jgi:ribonuclease HIII
MNHVLTLDDAKLAEIAEYYAESELENNEPFIAHVYQSERFRITVYKSKKVMFQGPGAIEELAMWAEIFDLDIELHNAESLTPKPSLSQPVNDETALGSDEVGTGDYFGPVVVACAFVRKDQLAELTKLGVKDSKKLSDDQIRSIAPTLEQSLIHQIVVLPNPKYNEMVAKGFNLNKIKSYLHNHAIRKTLQLVKEPYDKIVIDQFTPKDKYFEYLADYENVVKNLTFEERAESTHVCVAAASILARYAFLRGIDELNAKLKLLLPLGANPIVDLIGKRIVLEHGEDILNEIAKVHFKNTERIRTSLPKRP